MASKSEARGLLSLPKTYLETMKESPKYTWFKPVLALILFGVFYFLFSIILSIIQEFFGYDALGLNEVIGAVANNDNYLDGDLTDPLQVFFMSMMVGIMIPASALAAKVAGVGSLGPLSSVENRLRWGRMAKLALPIFAVTCLFTIGVPVIASALDGGIEQLGTPQFAPAGLIAILLFVPFQCAGEEYFFRGLIQKALGSWTPVPVVVILLQSLAFASMHGYDLLGNFGIMLTGIVWGWLAIKTEGLEVTTVLHSANNVTAMAMSTVFVSATVTKTTSIGGFFFDITGTLVAAALAYYLCKRFGYIK